MMKAGKKHDIEGKTYEIWKLNPETSLEVLYELMSILGVGAGEGIAKMNLDKSGSKTLMDAMSLGPDAVGTAISGIFRRMDAKTFVRIVKQLLECVKLVEGDKARDISIQHPNFEDQLHLLKLAYKVLEVNYERFLGGISDVVEHGKKLISTSVKQMSTGTSGDPS